MPKQVKIYSAESDAEQRRVKLQRSQNYAGNDFVQYVNDIEEPWSEADQISQISSKVWDAEVASNHATLDRIKKENPGVDQVTLDKTYGDALNSEIQKQYELVKFKGQNTKTAQENATKGLLESGAARSVLPTSFSDEQMQSVKNQESYQFDVPQLIAQNSESIGHTLNPKESVYWAKNFRNLETPQDIEQFIRDTPVEYTGVHKVAQELLGQAAEKHLGVEGDHNWMMDTLLGIGGGISGVSAGGAKQVSEFLRQNQNVSMKDLPELLSQFAQGTGQGAMSGIMHPESTDDGFGGYLESQRAMDRDIAAPQADIETQKYVDKLSAKGITPTSYDIAGVRKNATDTIIRNSGGTPADEAVVGPRDAEDLFQTAASFVVPLGGPLKRISKPLGKAATTVMDAAPVSWQQNLLKIESFFNADAAINKTIRTAVKSGKVSGQEAELLSAELKNSNTVGIKAGQKLGEEYTQAFREVIADKNAPNSWSNIFKAVREGKNPWSMIKDRGAEMSFIHDIASKSIQEESKAARAADMWDVLFKHNMAVATDSAEGAAKLVNDLGAATGQAMMTFTGNEAKQIGKVIGQPNATHIVLPKPLGFDLKDLIVQQQATWSAKQLLNAKKPNADFTQKGVASAVKAVDWVYKNAYQPILSTYKVMQIYSSPLTQINNFKTNLGLLYVQEGARAANPTGIAASGMAILTEVFNKGKIPEFAKKIYYSGFSHPVTAYDLGVAFKKAGLAEQMGAHYATSGIGLQTGMEKGVEALTNVVSVGGGFAKQAAKASDLISKGITFTNKLQKLGAITDDNIKIAAEYTSKMTGNYAGMSSYFDKVAKNITSWYIWKSFYWVRTGKNLLENPGRMAQIEQYRAHNRQNASQETDRNLFLNGTVPEYQKNFTVATGTQDKELQKLVGDKQDTVAYIAKSSESLTDEVGNLMESMFGDGSGGQAITSNTNQLVRPVTIAITGYDPLTGKHVAEAGMNSVQKGIMMLPEPVLKSFRQSWILAHENDDHPTIANLVNMLTFMSSKQELANLISEIGGGKTVPNPTLGDRYQILTPDTFKWSNAVNKAKEVAGMETAAENQNIVKEVTESGDSSDEKKSSE